VNVTVPDGGDRWAEATTAAAVTSLVEVAW
jgi:hypothetical protein